MSNQKEVLYGLAANLPTAQRKGRFYVTSDTFKVNLDTGSAWIALPFLGLDPSTLARGDVIVVGSGNVLARLPAGTAGKVFTTQGSGADPTYSTVASLLVGAHNGTDSHTIHAYYCNEAVGATTLVDSGTGTSSPLTLIGTANTDYVLGTTRPFRYTNGLRLLRNNANAGATATVGAISGGEVSVEAMVVCEEYVTSGSGINGFVTVNTGSNDLIIMGIVGSNGKIFGGTHRSAADHNTETDGATSVLMPLGIPTHVALTYKAANGLRVYRNGVLVGQNTFNNGALPALTTMTIGNNESFNSGMRGWVGEVRVHNIERTAAEILAAAQAALSL